MSDEGDMERRLRERDEKERALSREDLQRLDDFWDEVQREFSAIAPRLSARGDDLDDLAGIFGVPRGAVVRNEDGTLTVTESVPVLETTLRDEVK